MQKCSVRSCNNPAIAGFAEEIEVGTFNSPQRTIPGPARYWCQRHSCLALETQGKLGHAIDLSSAAASDAKEDREFLPFPPSAVELDDCDGAPGSIGGSSAVPGERRKRERFPIDGMAEVNIPNCGILFRGLTSDLTYDGCYIQTPAYLGANVGEQVEVRFSVSNVHFRAAAKVTAIRRGKGAGFEFLHVEEEAQNNLNTLMNKLGSTTSVPAELSPQPTAHEFAAKDNR